MNLVSRPGVVVAAATMLILPPANSFALPADAMAGKVASAAVRFLGSEDFFETRDTSVVCGALPDAESRPTRSLFESEGWTVVRYSEQALTS